jgi:N-acetylglutamate synthase-like GNAT family acetyltransferase
MSDSPSIITIRHYQPSDLDACRALWVELAEWHRQIYNSPGIGGLNPGLLFDEHLERVGAEHIWVAEKDGKVVGMAGLILEGDEAELEPISVSQAFRSTGVGRQLAQAVITAAHAAGMPLIKVKPVARNATAIRFFHDLGFDTLGQIELFLDFKPEADRRWRAGGRIANRDFRV